MVRKIMTDVSAVFILCGVVLVGFFIFALLTGKVLGRYTIEDRNVSPALFWSTLMANGLLALACFYLAWVNL